MTPMGVDSVIDSAGVEHMDESAAAGLFGKMQQYAREKIFTSRTSCTSPEDERPSRRRSKRPR